MNPQSYMGCLHWCLLQKSGGRSEIDAAMLRPGLCYYLMIFLITHAHFLSRHRDALKLKCRKNANKLKQFFFLQLKIPMRHRIESYS